MEENKVTISLDDFLEEHDHMKDMEFLVDSIVDYLLLHSELENGKLVFDYSFRKEIMTEIVKKCYPAKYNKRLEELKKEEEHK